MAALPYPAYGFSTTLLPDGVVNALSGLRLRAQPVASVPLYCRMAAKRLIRPTFTSATRGFGAALLPDGGETPYPAYGSLF
jgi:hypothetical protein